MKNLLLAALLVPGAFAPALAQSSAQVRPVATFHAINVGTGIELTITAGTSQRVEVSADTPELRDRIQTSVANGVLTLHYDNRDDRQGRQRQNKHLRASITADRLTALTAGSGASFDGASLQTDRTRAEASSGSSIQVAVKDDLVAEASSGGSVNYKGSPQLTKRTSSGGSVSGH